MPTKNVFFGKNSKAFSALLIAAVAVLVASCATVVTRPPTPVDFTVVQYKTGERIDSVKVRFLSVNFKNPQGREFFKNAESARLELKCGNAVVGEYEPEGFEATGIDYSGGSGVLTLKGAYKIDRLTKFYKASEIAECDDYNFDFYFISGGDVHSISTTRGDMEFDIIDKSYGKVMDLRGYVLTSYDSAAAFVLEAERLRSVEDEFLPTSENFRVEVIDESGKTVWSTNYRVNFMQVIGEVEPTEPGATKVYTVWWNGKKNEGEFADPGTYTARMTIPAAPEPYILETKFDRLK